MRKKDRSQEPIYRIETCKFQREPDSEWEPGVLINEGDKGIFDAQNQVPEQIWDYKTFPGFCLDISDFEYWSPFLADWLEHITKLITAD